MFPTKRQWKSWSLPSKLTAIGTLVGVISLGLYLRDKAFDQGIDANELARKIVEQLPPASTPSLEDKEYKIKKLEETIKRLQSSPGHQYKEAAMRALAASNVVEATELLEQSANYYAEESHKLSSQSAQDWLDVGVLAETYDEEKALHAYQRALQLDPENPSAWNYLGLIELRLNNVGESKRAFDKVLALSGNDKSTQAAAYGNLGLVYKDSDPEKAEEYFLKSLEIDKSNGEQGRVANQYINLGLLYERQGDFNKAEELYRKSLDIRKNINDQQGMAVSNINLGTLYLRRGNTNEAKQSYLGALKLLESEDDPLAKATIYANLGTVYLESGDLEKAEEAYRQSLAMRIAVNHQANIDVIYAQLGKIYQRRIDLDKSAGRQQTNGGVNRE